MAGKIDHRQLVVVHVDLLAVMPSGGDQLQRTRDSLFDARLPRVEACDLPTLQHPGINQWLLSFPSRASVRRGGQILLDPNAWGDQEQRMLAPKKLAISIRASLHLGASLQLL